MNYNRLFEELNLGHTSLANRIVMGSMHTGLEEAIEGADKLAHFYAARASAGLIVTGGFSPNEEGRVAEGSGTFSSENQLPFHEKITSAVHVAGGKIALQILHTGRYGYHKKAVAPSALQAPINVIKPKEMGGEDVLRTIADFANCAKLAQLAGYDGVEIMGSEGYLLNQFIAPRTNKRTDEWGGSFANRIRFPLAIVNAVRTQTGPNFIVIFRLSMLDLVPEGSTWQEVVALAKELENAGVDIINTGIGWHESRVPTIASNVPPAAFAWVTKKLRSEVKLPLIAVNRINTPEIAESLLEKQFCDLVSMARPLLADPELPKKAKLGKPELINSCIACNQACLDHIFEHKTATCLVNPFAAQEELELKQRELAKQKVNVVKKTSIAVVGAGPAGLAAAVHAATLGFQVCLFEASKSIGGQFQLASKVPGKEDYLHTIRFFEAALAEHKVSVYLRHHAAPLELQSFDHIIVATGVAPRSINLPGMNLPHVCTYADILSGRVIAGESVVIVGSGGIGFDVAEFLCHDAATQRSYNDMWGIDETIAGPGGLKEIVKESWHTNRKITMLQRKPGKPGETLGKTTGWIHKASLKNFGVTTLSGVQYEGIVAEGIRIKHQDEFKLLLADTVVICAGQESNKGLHEKLLEQGSKSTLVGGAKLAAELDAKRAITEGMGAVAKVLSGL